MVADRTRCYTAYDWSDLASHLCTFATRDTHSSTDLGAHEYTDESYCSTNMGPDSARCHAAPHCGTEQVAHGLSDLGPDAGTVLCSDQ